MTAASASTWRRAAVLGSLWAAVEIVVGSVLHNLRIPFAGSVLGAVGVLLMTAGHRAGPERGLIWRSALICALMKSISPSAVILGPMVGIFMEGLLLEAMVRLFRGRLPGYVVGGALAVSWSMVQRILSTLISFGPDVVRLYVDAYRFASRSLGVESFGPFDLVATLFGLELVTGAVAALLGSSAATAPRTGAVASPAPVTDRRWLPGPPTSADANWSLPRLAVVSVALVAGLSAFALVPLWAALTFVTVFAGAVLHVYPKASARVRRPSLWLELGAVTLLSGLVFGGIRHGLAGLLSGAEAGVAMAARAVMVLFGFTAVSVELRNPVIMEWLERRRVRGLSDALGAAFGTLPAFIAALSEHRARWRHPRALAGLLLDLADTLVAAAPENATGRTCVAITGATGSGKTTLATAVVDRLQASGVRVAGILAPGHLSDGRRTGFDIIDIATRERCGLAREGHCQPGPHARWSRFAFDPAGLALGAAALGSNASADLIVVDEVGPFELSGGGWADSLDALRNADAAVLFVVRDSLLDAVVSRWGTTEVLVFHAGDEPARVAGAIGERLARTHPAPARCE